ncbi:HAD superfamily [Striga asiatica]|uniref:HAD superfamily n=1 Tax=Striga asiatica TaxID=4170 RepID=A0A5A7PW14_STRAF|nr:HAD superfamily [Striga asiatica]
MQQVATQQLFEEEASGTAGEEPMSRLCVFRSKEPSERIDSTINPSQENDALVVHKMLEQQQMSQGREMEEHRQMIVGGVAKIPEVEISTEAMEVREEVQLRNNRTWRRAIRQCSTSVKPMEDESEDQKDWNWVVNGPTKTKQGTVGTDIWVAELMANGGRNWDERLTFYCDDVLMWCLLGFSSLAAEGHGQLATTQHFDSRSFQNRKPQSNSESSSVPDSSVSTETSSEYSSPQLSLIFSLFPLSI